MKVVIDKVALNNAAVEWCEAKGEKWSSGVKVLAGECAKAAFPKTFGARSLWTYCRSAEKKEAQLWKLRVLAQVLGKDVNEFSKTPLPPEGATPPHPIVASPSIHPKAPTEPGTPVASGNALKGMEIPGHRAVAHADRVLNDSEPKEPRKPQGEILQKRFSDRLSPEDELVSSYGWWGTPRNWIRPGRHEVRDLTYREERCFWGDFQQCQYSEYWLYGLKLQGLVEIRRLFVVDLTTLKSPTDLEVLYRVSTRHKLLGYEPKLVCKSEINLKAQFGMNAEKFPEEFDGMFAYGDKYVVFIQMPPTEETITLGGANPLMVKTEKPDIIKDALTFHDKLWAGPPLSFTQLCGKLGKNRLRKLHSEAEQEKEDIMKYVAVIKPTIVWKD